MNRRRFLAIWATAAAFPVAAKKLFGANGAPGPGEILNKDVLWDDFSTYGMGGALPSNRGSWETFEQTVDGYDCKVRFRWVDNVAGKPGMDPAPVIEFDWVHMAKPKSPPGEDLCWPQLIIEQDTRSLSFEF